MTVEESIYGRLAPLFSNRVYPLVAPQNAVLPYCIYQRIGNDPVDALRTTTGLVGDRFQVTSYANSYSAAQTLGRQVRGRLDILTATPTDEISVGRWLNQLDNIEAPTPGAEKPVFKVIQEYHLWNYPATS